MKNSSCITYAIIVLHLNSCNSQGKSNSKFSSCTSDGVHAEGVPLDENIVGGTGDNECLPLACLLILRPWTATGVTTRRGHEHRKMEASVAVTQQNEGIGGRNTAKLRYRWPQHRKMEASVAVTPQNGGIGGRNTAK